MAVEFYAEVVFTLGVCLIGWLAADRGRWRRPVKSAERSNYGPNAKRWAARRGSGPIDSTLARTIDTGLLSFQARRDGYQSAR